MIGFKTLYSEATEGEYFVTSCSLVDEKPNFKGKTVYSVDLIPYDEDNFPTIYNMPVMVDRSEAATEYYIPNVEEVICSGCNTYNFDNEQKTDLSIIAELKGDMLNIPAEKVKTDMINVSRSEINKIIKSLKILAGENR